MAQAVSGLSDALSVDCTPELLAGVLPPARGRLLSVTGAPLDDAARSAHIFYVPDGIRPYPDQPVSWVLDYAVGFFGGRASLKAELIDQLQLTPLLHKRVGVLSKGQAKRALLAFGLLTPQPILMIDEPFEGLDLKQTREAAATLREHADV